MFCVFCAEDYFSGTRNPVGGCQAEAEPAPSAGRRTRPEAVSGRMKSNGLGRSVLAITQVQQKRLRESFARHSKMQIAIERFRPARLGAWLRR
jgi:hypothetical protein